jgi:H+/Cl- antiporter ClcA
MFGVGVTAIIAGLCGSLMSKLILKVIRWRSSFKKRSTTILQIIAGALIVAAIAYFISGKILGSGKGLMTTVLFSNNKHVEWYTPVLRIAGIIISFSTGSAGGVFAPSLAAGASIGAWFSGLFNVLGSNANILILSGMVAFLTGVTRTPFTSAILVLEMTDRHGIIFHLLLAALIANLVSMVIDKHSLYDHLKKEYTSALDYSNEKPAKNEEINNQ